MRNLMPSSAINPHYRRWKVRPKASRVITGTARTWIPACWPPCSVGSQQPGRGTVQRCWLCDLLLHPLTLCPAMLTDKHCSSVLLAALFRRWNKNHESHHFTRPPVVRYWHRSEVLQTQIRHSHPEGKALWRLFFSFEACISESSEAQLKEGHKIVENSLAVSNVLFMQENR